MIYKKLSFKQYFLAMLFIVFLANITIILNIHPLRQIMVFFVYTVIPGLLIVYILRINNSVEFIDKFLLTIGLSVSFIMMSGGILNFLLPVFGCSKPISTVPLVVSYSIIFTFLCVLAYLRNRSHNIIINIDSNSKSILKLLLGILFLLLVFLLFVLGAFMVSYWHNNMLLMMLFPFLGIFLLIIQLDSHYFQQKLYPLIIGLISLSMMYQLTLSSPLISGSDIYLEYYFQNQVIKNSIWNPHIQHNYNSILSINILLPIYSLLMGISSTCVIKVIYPIFFSIAIVGMFEMYKKQFDDKIALLASFLFISLIPPTYIFSLLRQQLAEFFLVLMTLTMMSKDLSIEKKRIISITFFTSIVLSHYALATIAVGFIIFGAFQKMIFQRMKLAYPLQIDIIFTSICLSIWFMWYGYLAASASLIISLGTLGKTVIISMLRRLLFSEKSWNPGTLVGLGLDFWEVNIWGKIFRIIQYFLEIFTVLGVISFNLGSKTESSLKRINLNYLALVNSSFVLLVLSIILPNFATAMNIIRIYHITMIFLSPLCIMGGMILGTFFSRKLIFAVRSFVSNILSKNYKSYYSDSRKYDTSVLKHFNKANSTFITIMLTIYLLFNSGFVFEITKSSDEKLGELPRSISLSCYRVDGNYFVYEEMLGAKWIASYSLGTLPIYGDHYSWVILRGYLGPERAIEIRSTSEVISNNSLLFLRRYNIEEGEIFIRHLRSYFSHYKIYEIQYFYKIIKESNIIYNANRTKILYIP